MLIYINKITNIINIIINVNVHIVDNITKTLLILISIQGLIFVFLLIMRIYNIVT